MAKVIEELQVTTPGIFRCPAASMETKPPVIVWSDTMHDHINNTIDNSSNHYSTSLLQVHEFAKLLTEKHEFITNYKGFVPATVEILRNVSEIESMIEVLNLIISKDSRFIEELHDLIFRNNKDCLSPFVLLLEKGNLKSKISSAKLVESIASTVVNSQAIISENRALLTGLYNLVSSETNQAACATGLSALISVSQSRNVKNKLVRLGIVRTAGKILSNPETEVAVIEKVMKILEMVSTCMEGRTAICVDERCIQAIITRLMNVSVTATEHGIGVLWSLCYLSGDRMAKEAVAKSNGVTKVVLVMQSNCSGSVRQMCGDLVKVFRVNSKSWLTSYDTRTTRASLC